MEGHLNFQGGLSLSNRDLIIDLSKRNRLTAVYQSKLFVKSGGLMALSPNQEEQFRTAARYADKVVRGAKSSDLPIQYPGSYSRSIWAQRPPWVCNFQKPSCDDPISCSAKDRCLFLPSITANTGPLKAEEIANFAEGNSITLSFAKLWCNAECGCTIYVILDHAAGPLKANRD